MHKYLGAKLMEQLTDLAAQGAERRIQLAVDQDHYSYLNSELTRGSSLAGYIKHATSSLHTWWIILINGPQEDSEKTAFLNRRLIGAFRSAIEYLELENNVTSRAFLHK
jgi:hypothetical protein